MTRPALPWRHWPALLSLVLTACGGGGGGTGGGNGSGTTPPGPPTISIGNASLAEGNSGTTTMTFTVSLSAAATGTVTVDYTVAAGTATAGEDYTDPGPGTLSFPAGTTSRSIAVTIHGDLVPEADETFQVQLANAVGATIATGTATGTIRNDDTLPNLSVTGSSVSEGNSGTKPLAFTISLNPAAATTVSVDYATANGNALAGSDYVATSGTVTFPAGTTSQVVTVTVNGDTDAETDESFSLVLANPSGAVILQGTAQGTIGNDDGTALFGLDARPANPSASGCVAPPRPTSGAGVTLEAFSDYSFTQPTKILQTPGDPTHWYVLEKAGYVKRFESANVTSITTFLDIHTRVDARGEGGLLGMAFHPNYPATAEAFIVYTTPANGGNGYEMVTRVARLKLDGGTNPPEEVLLTLNQPELYHKGGEIAFGPGGYLYVGFGDGATALADRDAQNMKKLLGKLIRIGVNGVAFPNPGYTIPADNPYAGKARCGTTGGTGADDCAEIYASGFRNPWRWSFDPPTGRLWLADVGEKTWEEIDLVQKGGNYGWPEREGAHCTPELYPGGTGCATTANGQPLIDPVAEYAHDGTNGSVTGGFVYHGSAIPELQGKYLFADFLGNALRTVTDNGDGTFSVNSLTTVSNGITDFARGLDGEPYLADFDNGVVRKIVLMPGGTASDEVWTDLADSPCVDASDPSQPGPGLIPYGVNAPFWSDGVHKDRWLAIPDGTTVSVDANHHWTFPKGSVILKVFRLNGNPIETRMFMRHPDGEWRGYTWEWNGSSATRIKDGKTRLIDGQNWIYPSEADCLRCHTAAAGYTLGPETAQLNGEQLYPSTGRTANQLATLDHIGLFAAPIGNPGTLPALANPEVGSQALSARARAWLHSNCAGCHRPGGPTSSSMDLRYDTPLAETHACNVAVAAGGSFTDPKLIKPGDAANSMVRARISNRGPYAMPPLGSTVVDAAAVTLITDWINGLSGCN